MTGVTSPKVSFDEYLDDFKFIFYTDKDILASPKALILLVVGGLFVGFGTRYAGGCTSGHAITGLSSLQKPSLIAVIGFFIGGLIMANLILPLIF